MRAILRDDYEKIADILCYLGNNTVLKFNLILGKQLKDGTRFDYHHEYRYNSNKYINKKDAITVVRSYDYYLSIESTIDPSLKEMIIIKYQDIYYIRQQFTLALDWLHTDKYYAYSNNKLVLLGKPNPIVIQGLVNSKYIVLEPIVITNDDEKTFPGVRMTLASDDIFVDLYIPKFMELYSIIMDFNMIMSAQIGLNYMQRPAFGTNLKDFNSSNINNLEEPEAFTKCNIEKRTIPGQRQKSFFSKIDDI